VVLDLAMTMVEQKKQVFSATLFSLDFGSREKVSREQSWIVQKVYFFQKNSERGIGFCARTSTHLRSNFLEAKGGI
jgi:hypothetical protein